MKRLQSFLIGLAMNAVVWSAMVLHLEHGLPGAANLLRFYGLVVLMVAALSFLVLIFGSPIKLPNRHPEDWLFRVSGWVFLGVCIWHGMWLLVVASVSVRLVLVCHRICAGREVAHG